MRSHKLAVAVMAVTALAGWSTAEAKKVKDDKPAAPEATTKPTTAKIFDLPYLQKELPNGLKVIVVQTPQKGVVSLQIPMQTGSRNEVEPGKTGFAHFFEHMMFRGTEQNPAERYEARIKAAGADQNAYTTDDYTNYYTNFTPADLDEVLALEADRFEHLKYSEAQFRTEALAVKGEYLKNFANPLIKAEERMGDLAYTVHTYKHSTMGFFADIEKMPDQLEYAKTFFDRWYRPQNATVIVAGDVDLEATAKLVEKHWGGWERKDYAVEVPVEPPQKQAKYEHLKWDAPTLPYLLVGWHAPAFSADKTDLPALTLLGQLYFGETSPLYQKLVVQEQLVDQLEFEAPRNRDPGMFEVYARMTKPENTAAVVAAIQDTLVKARTELVDPAQLAAVKSRLKYSFARSMASASSIGATLATFVRYERDLETLNRYYRSFDRVEARDLVDVANRVFADTNRTVVSVSNQDKLEGADGFKPIDAEVAKAGTHAAPAPAADKPQAAAATPKKKTAKEIFAERDQAEYDASAAKWAAQQGQLSTAVFEQRSTSPLVDVSLLIKAGATYDPPGKKGLAYLTASMVADAGSGKMSYEQIQKAMFPLATGLESQVDKDMVRLHAQVHRDNLAKFWDVASSQIENPGFAEADFKRLKQQQLNDLKVGLRSNNDEEFAKEALYERIYGPDHPYGSVTLGHATDIESITLDDVKGFYNQWYLRNRVSIGLAGGYDDAFKNRVLATVGLLDVEPKGTQVYPAPQPERRSKRHALVIQKESPSVAVSFGFPLDVKRGDKDWPALWLMRAWLGEHRSSKSHLYQRIREERGMNYGDYAYIEYFPRGMYAMQPEPNYARRNDIFQVWIRPVRSNNDALFATRVALYEVQKLIDQGMSASDFEATREYLKKYVAVLTAHQSKALGYGLDSAWYKTPPFVEYVRKALDELTLEQVNAAIKAHLKLDGVEFVFVGKDAKDLADKLAKDAPSPITYNTQKPDALVAEDKVIAKLPLKLGKDGVEVKKDSEMFE